MQNRYNAAVTDNLAKPRRPWVRIARTAAITLASSIFVILLLFYLLQNKLLFYPERHLPQPPRSQVPEVEVVTFNAADGVKLVSWWLPPKPGRPTIVFFQGNAGNLAHRSDRLFDCKEHGWGLLLLGYRGYGDSGGSPDEPGLYLDARAALAWLRSRPDVEGKKIVYQAESLGCAVALELAVAEPPACVVLEAPFSTLKAIAAVVAHGTRDEIVPFKQGKAVFDAAPGPKKLYELNSRHNDIAETGSKELRAAVAEFIEGAVKGR
ncbi:MAG: alpha/beta hydrolase [Planctomycetes bacterium]|nr:alpha/beta hydrolase [Planctomycetota bacterium]